MNKFATRKSLYGLVTAATLSLLVVGPTLAADDLGAGASTTATVSAGDRTISDPSGNVAFIGRSITGVAQSTTGTLGPFKVKDMSGTNDGWQVSIEADQVVGANTAYEIPVNSLALSTLPTVGEFLDNAWDSAEIVATAGVDIDAGPVELASAAVDAGMGQHNFTTSGLTLSLPADILADTYNVDVSLTLAVGPVV